MSSKKNRVAGQKRKFKEQDDVAIEIYTDDRCIFKIQKSKLIEKSPVFKAMFGHDTKENQTNVVKIPGFKPITVLLFLKYLKEEDIECPSQKIAKEMFKLSDYYQIEGFETRCVQLIYTYLTVDNVFDYFEMAKQFESNELKETCIDFMSQNINLKTICLFHDFTEKEEGLDRVLEAIFTFVGSNWDEIENSKEWENFDVFFQLKLLNYELKLQQQRSEALFHQHQIQMQMLAQNRENLLAIFRIMFDL